jgi:molybdopterin molybdotransferase
MFIKPTKLEDARKKLIENISLKNEKIKVPIVNSLGRVNCSTIKSKINLPSTKNSAVDGYGILHKTIVSNPQSKFTVVGIAKAGHPYNKTIQFEEAIEIYTGAVTPKGIDTVVMHENCERVGNQLIIKDHVTKNQNIRPIGENLKKNEIVIKKGKIINAADIGQLAASGSSEIEIYSKVKVSVISTGDELVSSISKQRLNGQIYDANRPMLLSLLNSNYLETFDMGIVKDIRKDLANKYVECLSKSDVVISSGGASDGVEDHTQNALKDIGAKCMVWQLAMKPGKPMAIGLLGKKIIFCLPGNPVAAFVCTKLLIKPLIIKLAGGVNLNSLCFKLPSGFEHNKKTGRAEYLRAKIINEDSKTIITLHGRKGAGVISSLTGADGIVEIPMEYKSVVKGELLKFFPFDHRGL